MKSFIVRRSPEVIRFRDGSVMLADCYILGTHVTCSPSGLIFWGDPHGQAWVLACQLARLMGLRVETGAALRAANGGEQ